MAKKKVGRTRAIRGVENLPAKSLSAKQAVGVKAGEARTISNGKLQYYVITLEH